MIGLFGLAEPDRKFNFVTRATAIINCIKRTKDPTRKACLEHALYRVKSEAYTKAIATLLATPGTINGRRTDFN
jgi:hypothetical protein